MSAWDKLLAASSLLAGTAWQLISSPKTGGGSGGTVYVQQISASVDDGIVTATVSTDVDNVTWQDNTISSTVTVIDAAPGVSDDLIRGSV